MKKIVSSLIGWAFFLISSSLFAQSQVDFTVKFNSTTNEYEVYAKPLSSGTFSVGGGSQISIVTPSSVGDAAFSVTNVAGGIWSDQSQIYNPAAQLGSDFHGIATDGTGAALNLTAGVETLLFKFSLGGSCVAGVRIYRNATEGASPRDPSSAGAGMGGGDFENFFTVSSGATSGNQFYNVNYNNAGTTCTVATDTDGDGVADSLDLDDDNDGILDTIEAAACTPSVLTCDSDGDGIINSLDLDSDNDGIKDVIEAGGTDPDNDGKPGTGTPAVGTNGVPIAVGAGLTPFDTDSDGKTNPYDLDSDGDGIPDATEGTTDTDNDGKPNYLDTDSDNDGVLDATDQCPTVVGVAPTGCPADTDGDGVADANDLDDDNDGILDTVEAAACTPNALTCDTDGDGTPNVLDLDSDNDGIKDVIEAGGIDPDNDGKPGSGAPTVGTNGVPTLAGTGLTPVDTDGDGKTNPYDLDSDGDGIPDSVEGTTDTDGDGKPNYLDIDSDGDGIPDATEGTVDTDGDGKPNYLDSDSDGDGIMDSVEGTTDTDLDGKPNYLDTDSDGDGKPDATEGTTDTDGDGKPNYLDTDSDNDGVLDATDQCPLVVGTAPSGCPTDSDGDGIVDASDLDDDNDGILDSIENGVCTPPALTCDTDNDGIPNNLDLDSDNDGIKDVIEAGGTDPDNDGRPGTGTPTVGSNGVPTLAGTGLVPVDTDLDGKLNPYDVDSDGDGIPDSVEGTIDTDGDGKPNYLDSDSDGDGIADATEGTTDPDGDGKPNYLDTDSDGDGKPDSTEGVADPDGDGKPNYLDTDSDGDGVPDLTDQCPYVSGVAPTGCPADTDGDGIADNADLDDDNDGILDTIEASACIPSASTCDTDGDGIPNILDLDSDNDGIKDVVEAGGSDPDNNGMIGTGIPTVGTNGVPTLAGTGLNPVDTDSDGKTNPYDVDSDGDGISDAIEGKIDTDGDGKPNYLDTDSDGDGISDSVEGITDVDNDGIPNYLDTDSDNDGKPDSVEGTTDTDGDGKPNYLDTDSDNDGVLDATDQCPLVIGIAPTGCPGAAAPDLVLTYGSPNPALTVGTLSSIPVTVSNVGAAIATGQLVFTFNIPNNTTSPASYNAGNGWVCSASGSMLTCVNPNASGITPSIASTFNIQLTPMANSAGQTIILNGTITPVPTETVVPNNTNVTVLSTPIAPGATAITLTLKAFLQGAAVNGTGGLMRDDLRTKNLIPNAQPYTAIAGYTHVAGGGTETLGAGVLTTTGNNAIVDWVMVELRSSANPATVVATRSALIQRDGDIVDVNGTSALSFGTLAAGNYYISVRHRNHLSVMTGNTVAVSTTTPLVDFTSTSLANNVFAVGNLKRNIYPQVTDSGKNMLWAGNAYRDDKVIFQGPDNDVDAIFFSVMTDPTNTSQFTNFIRNTVYDQSDIDMNGQVIFQGPNNEVDLIFFEVLTHPSNTSQFLNYIIWQQMP